MREGGREQGEAGEAEDTIQEEAPWAMRVEEPTRPDISDEPTALLAGAAFERGERAGMQELYDKQIADAVARSDDLGSLARNLAAAQKTAERLGTEFKDKIDRSIESLNVLVSLLKREVLPNQQIKIDVLLQHITRTSGLRTRATDLTTAALAAKRAPGSEEPTAITGAQEPTVVVAPLAKPGQPGRPGLLSRIRKGLGF